jgi:hypothetical protein
MDDNVRAYIDAAKQAGSSYRIRFCMLRIVHDQLSGVNDFGIRVR